MTAREVERWRADVRRPPDAPDAPGATRHFDLAGPLPQAARLELGRDGDGWFLVRLSITGAFAGDTWHATREAAIEQARFEFAVSPDDWIAAG
ncbi:MAG: hypothetical protein L6Q99_18050 [Planctomycetes bacterium]|nr:hypothetical protein [Planctomycetota bacterium]